VIARDFMELKGGAGTDGCIGQFDAVVMNPPFENAADVRHIVHALRMVKPGGRLVAICANGPRQQAVLRPLVEQHGGEWEELPADTFKAEGTGVRTALLTLTA
jgi:16S rRNA G1207 methylase RsmC